MNQSPIKNSSLRDTIRCIEAYDSSLLPIKSIYENTYITKSNIDNFMYENNIVSSDIVLDTIREMNNIKGNILIVDDDKDFSTLSELCSLLESLDAKEIISVANGEQLSKMKLDKIAAFILRREYNDLAEIDRYIKQCDRLLEDIAEEKKIVKDKKQNSSYKFTARFFMNIIRSIFKSIIIPMVVTKKIKLPEPLAKIYKAMMSSAESKASTINNKRTSEGKKPVPTNINSYKKAIKVASTITDVIVPNAIDIYLSFKDYDKLLSNYENSILSVKRDLETKRDRILSDNRSQKAKK